ncbi:hypothetical protein RRG08_003480 [Elysia crispata]|uniref:C2H2-type domain-containing protein n=1 Tax=Elysia crispata TaxID=231223 RepID=A0AAE1CTY5_9GAST|nr:hypothetical protein RRG08_003480 [Elysia crispata]
MVRYLACGADAHDRLQSQMLGAENSMQPTKSRNRRKILIKGLAPKLRDVCNNGSGSTFAPSAIKASSSCPTCSNISESTPASGGTSVLAVRKALSNSLISSSTLESTLLGRSVWLTVLRSEDPVHVNVILCGMFRTSVRVLRWTCFWQWHGSVDRSWYIMNTRLCFGRSSLRLPGILCVCNVGGKSERKYVCQICNHAFKQMTHLVQHHRIHTGERKYVCQICNRAFKQMTHLQQHHIIHTGERKYVCQVCNHAFKQMTHLQQHLRIHTGERKYVCQICNRAFKQLTHLQKHHVIHTGK